MKLIPVVDLMQGQVVHARLGGRQDYQPIQSPLCDSSEPISLIQALAALYRFDTLYIADLDAIQGNSGQIALLKLIQQNFPKIEILLDAGFNHAEQITQYPKGITPVIGSESLSSLQQLQNIHRHLNGSYVLSLDFKQGFLGCQEILQSTECWPEIVIAMCLSHVGSELGPDWECLQSCRALKPSAQWIAAGGVRHRQDLQALEKIGFSSVLLASALHKQAI